VNEVSEPIRGDQTFSVGPLAVAVLVDRSGADDALASISWTWVFTAAALFLAIIFALIIGHQILRPISEIEEGLLRIMNGDWTHRFDVRSSELGGLSYRINQLMSSLLGDEEEAEPGSEAASEAEAPAAADPKETRYQELYQKFQAAQRQVGQQPGSVSYADFRARLVDNEQKILQKNAGRSVDFELLVANNQITFKPIIK
jgi:methyl-accepting chemotaxis protein